MEIAQYERQQAAPPVDNNDDSSDAVARREYCKEELAAYARAKARWEPDHKRMKDNMDFVANLQWEEQTQMRDPGGRYICNLVLGAVKNKEAQLYAKNPEVEAKPTPIMRYELWDGSIEMLQEAMQGVQMMNQTGVPNMESIAIMRDFMRGKFEEEQVKKICKTLERVYQYQVDTSTPNFKQQMKKLVCRIITCGVAYILPNLVTPVEEDTLKTTEIKHSVKDRAKLGKAILDRLAAGDLNESSAEVETLKSLMLSLGVSQKTNDYTLDERIEFDFPSATSLFPDENCRDLQDFVAARRVFQEFPMYVDEVNAFFKLEGDDQVKSSTSTSFPDSQTEGQLLELGQDPAAQPTKRSRCVVVRIFNIETKCDYYVVVGHKEFVQEPMPLEPCVKGFWPIVAITFNNIESEPDTKASPYPPSDVELMRDPQKEWNRTRDALRAQRNANAPAYGVRKNVLSADDIEKLRTKEPNEVLEFENIPPNQDLSKVIQVLQVAAIDPAVYNTQPLEQDIMLAGRVQQANIGPAQPDVTATVGTIAEQSRVTSISSNVDDLDMGLSKLASMCGQLILQGFSEQTVKRIAGRGAMIPVLDRSEYLNQIDMTIKAASSGRPNEALRAAKAQQLLPLLMQLGANPLKIIEWLVPIIDENLDPQQFFPLPGQAMQVANPSSAGVQPPTGPGYPSPAPGGSGPIAPRPQLTAGGPQTGVTAPPHQGFPMPPTMPPQ